MYTSRRAATLCRVGRRVPTSHDYRRLRFIDRMAGACGDDGSCSSVHFFRDVEQDADASQGEEEAGAAGGDEG